MMETDDTTGPPPPRRHTLLAIAGLMLAMGLVMLLQGIGLHDAAWLNPNPNVPRWVFAILGVILVLSALLAAGQTHTLPARLINGAGYSILGLSWIVTHWLVFFAVGGSCEAESGNLLLNLPGFACRASMGAVVIILDLLLAALLYAKIRPSRRV